MEWTKEEYSRRLQEAFQKADRTGAGLITRKELIDVFQAIDSNSWSDDDFCDLFSAIDNGETGFVKYKAFIRYVMEEEDNEAEQDEEEEQGEFVDEQLERAVFERPTALNLDLDRWISCDEWVLIMERLVDEDVKEAERAFGLRAAELNEPRRSGGAGGGLPLRELLKELQLDLKDKESLQALLETVDAAANAVANGEGAQCRLQAADPFLGIPESPALRRAVQQVVRTLYLAERPLDDVTKVLSAGLVPLSEAERAAIQELGREPGRLLEMVKRYAREPPLLSAVAGLRACHELCDREVSGIIARCIAERQRYTDRSWDFTTAPARVLYVDGEKPGYDCTVARPSGVRRLSDIVAGSALARDAAIGALHGAYPATLPGSLSAAHARPPPRPVLFREGSHMGDIVQGQLGTCFLLGAMGAVGSSSQDAIRSLFVKCDVDVGVYGLRFNVDGEWKIVIVDDIMPVDAQGQLLYARSTHPQEVWVSVLEKAFCKLNTCYEMCDGGQTSEAVSTLFGGVCGKLQIMQCHRDDPSRYFRLLRQAHARSWLLTTDFNEVEEFPAGSIACAQAARPTGKCGDAVLPLGLISGHTYSVLKVLEAHGHRLVCLRNPWGSGEWTGRWSAYNLEGEWTEAMINATDFSGTGDGIFWMSIEDLVLYSNGVEYARSFGPEWKKISHYGRFRQGELLATAKCDFLAGNDHEISFSTNDQIEITSQSGNFWWRGRVWCVRLPGQPEPKKGFFPSGRVQVNERPIKRFNLTCVPTRGQSEPMTVVVVLSQPSAPMQRRFYRRREDKINCKDVSYPCLQLCIVSPQGQIVAKRTGRRRCLWVELQLPGRGCWRVYAVAHDGLGKSFSLRAYAKQGTANLLEVPGASLAEVATVPATEPATQRPTPRPG